MLLLAGRIVSLKPERRKTLRDDGGGRTRTAEEAGPFQPTKHVKLFGVLRQATECFAPVQVASA